MRTLTLKIDDEKLINASLNIGNGETVITRDLSEDKLKQYYQEKIASTPINILPPAIRYISNDQGWLIWEQRPGYRTISYTPLKQNNINASEASRYSYRIPVPWQQYAVCFTREYVITEMYMFFRKQPLGQGRNPNVVCYAPLNNFYRDNKLCQAVYENIPEANNLYKMLDNVFNMVWNSGFNNDLAEAHTYAVSVNGTRHLNNPLLAPVDSYTSFYKMWENTSLHDVMTYEWPVLNTNVYEFLDARNLQSSNINIVQFLQDIHACK